MNVAATVAGVNRLPAGGGAGPGRSRPRRRPDGPPGSELPPLMPTIPGFASSPLGVGGHLAPHFEALPRFEIQVAGDQTLRR